MQACTTTPGAPLIDLAQVMISIIIGLVWGLAFDLLQVCDKVRGNYNNNYSNNWRTHHEEESSCDCRTHLAYAL